MEDKIILKFNTKNILNFYEIEPWSKVKLCLNGMYFHEKYIFGHIFF